MFVFGATAGQQSPSMRALTTIDLIPTTTMDRHGFLDLKAQKNEKRRRTRAGSSRPSSRFGRLGRTLLAPSWHPSVLSSPPEGRTGTVCQYVITTPDKSPSPDRWRKTQIDCNFVRRPLRPLRFHEFRASVNARRTPNAGHVAPMGN